MAVLQAWHQAGPEEAHKQEEEPAPPLQKCSSVIGVFSTCPWLGELWLCPTVRSGQKSLRGPAGGAGASAEGGARGLLAVARLGSLWCVCLSRRLLLTIYPEKILGQRDTGEGHWDLKVNAPIIIILLTGDSGGVGWDGQTAGS